MVKGEYWSEDYKFLPKELIAEERSTAMHEIRSLPESFYKTFKLPVITPDNVKDWLKEHVVQEIGNGFKTKINIHIKTNNII